jgi:hypothetical protein
MQGGGEIDAVQLVGIHQAPLPKPWVLRMVSPPSNGLPPRTASRSRSEKEPMPVPARCFWVACTKRLSSCTSPKFHPRRRSTSPD